MRRATTNAVPSKTIPEPTPDTKATASAFWVVNARIRPMVPSAVMAMAVALSLDPPVGLGEKGRLGAI